MKRMKKINVFYIGALVYLLLLSSCKGKDGHDAIIDYIYTYNFTMINNSGVQVAVVAGNDDFPDSLVLLNGAKYEWVMYDYHYTWPLDDRYAPKVYFDKDILVVHNYDDMSARNPGAGSNYETVKVGEFTISETFTFTPKDYQNALEQNEK